MVVPMVVVADILFLVPVDFYSEKWEMGVLVV